MTNPSDPVTTSLEPLPQDLGAPQLTVRAIATGVVLGGVLSLCNIYAGLKVGWGFNMSIIAVLMSFAFWRTLSTRWSVREWGLLENNTCQTAASAAASISSAGLVTAIPALTILTGQTLTWTQLAAWTLSVCFVGVFVGAGLRFQMLVRDALPFPAGIATAMTLRDIYAKDNDARSRVWALLAAAGIAGSTLLLHTIVVPVHRFYLKFALPFAGKLRDAGISSLNTAHLGWGIEPSLLLVGTGALVGFRIAASLFLGSIIAWGVLAPIALIQGWVTPPAGATGSLYGPLVKWLLWPGVALMVAASLTSFALSLPAIVRSLLRSTKDAANDEERRYTHPSTRVPRNVLAAAMTVALVFSVVLQLVLFGIAIWIGVLAVLLTFLLAVVAARVSGITGITPKGALGKVTQLTFGGLSPGQVVPNLMAANVTAGAAAQTGDILHDLKTGYLVGASPRAQLIAQLFGIFAGALIGSAAYLLLVPDPAAMLLTDEWPAPAVAVWKSVAEVFKEGIASLPQTAVIGGVIGLIVGCAMALLQSRLSERRRRYTVSPAALGLAFILPATAGVAIFVGGVLLVAAGRISADWTKRYAIAIAAGLIAGESLFGMVTALLKPLTG